MRQNDGNVHDWQTEPFRVLVTLGKALRPAAGAHDPGALLVGAPWLAHFDRVHANDVGHQIVADTIFRTLATNCSGLAARTRRIEQKSPRWREEATPRADYGYD